MARVHDIIRDLAQDALGDLGYLAALKEVEEVEVLEALLLERIRQDNKWGQQNHTDGAWWPIFQEELGEFARAENERDFEQADKELIEAAAVLLAWAAARMRRRRT
jgi:hypothetical protein